MNTGFLQGTARLASGRTIRIHWVWLSTEYQPPNGLIEIEVIQADGETSEKHYLYVSFFTDFRFEISIGGLTGSVRREEMIQGEPRIWVELVDKQRPEDSLKSCSWLGKFNATETGSLQTLANGFYSPSPFSLGRPVNAQTEVVLPKEFGPCELPQFLRT